MNSCPSCREDASNTSHLYSHRFSAQPSNSVEPISQKFSPLNHASECSILMLGKFLWLQSSSQVTQQFFSRASATSFALRSSADVLGLRVFLFRKTSKFYKSVAGAELCHFLEIRQISPSFACDFSYFLFGNSSFLMVINFVFSCANIFLISFPFIAIIV